MATSSSILSWGIPWTEEPGGLQSMGSQESDTIEHMHTHTPLGGRVIKELVDIIKTP